MESLDDSSSWKDFLDHILIDQNSSPDLFLATQSGGVDIDFSASGDFVSQEIELACGSINQLRTEGQELKDENEKLQEEIKSLKAEKNELREEKILLKADKERVEQQVKAISIPSTGYLQPHPMACWDE
ncbi:hypothetical protein EZV62_000870 [Acer yangbiense]|uniref:Uncharacterized protein n=1 Tax=Acer yangbiense TaxID=1000413 RepID=A0A5C7ISR4_9ROSI|nr:hypothetical protein EZV62_000870 [Acer yangbiense]